MAVGQAIRDNTPQAQFSQTAFIFGVVGFAFILFVTLRGDLPKWIGLLTFGAKSATPTQPGAVPPVTSNVVKFPTLPQLGTVVQ